MDQGLTGREHRARPGTADTVAEGDKHPPQTEPQELGDTWTDSIPLGDTGSWLLLLEPQQQREWWHLPGGHRGRGSAVRKPAGFRPHVQSTRTQAQTPPTRSYEMQFLNQTSESSSPMTSLPQQWRGPLPGDNRPGEDLTHTPKTCHLQEFGWYVF